MTSSASQYPLRRSVLKFVINCHDEQEPFSTSQSKVLSSNYGKIAALASAAASRSLQLMESLYSALNATAVDLVDFMRPHLVQARTKAFALDMVGRDSIAGKLEEDLHVAGDLLGILKLILDKDEWRGLELSAPRIFTRKFRSDLHQVRDLRNRLAHASFHTVSSSDPSGRLLDYLTFSLYLASINAPAEKCSMANQAVKSHMASMLSDGQKGESGQTMQISSVSPLPDNLGNKINEWATSQEAFWAEQISAIVRELKENPRVTPGETRSLEAALENSEKQHQEYVRLLNDYKGALDNAIQGKRTLLWAGGAVVLSACLIALYFGFARPTDVPLRAPDSATTYSEANSPRVGIDRLKDHMGQQVWIDGLRIVASDSFTSSSGRNHLRFTAEDVNGVRLGGIFFEGLWDENTRQTMKSGAVVSLKGKVGMFSGKPSLEAIRITVN
jgi:hypothetical protein